MGVSNCAHKNSKNIIQNSSLAKCKRFFRYLVSQRIIKVMQPTSFTTFNINGICIIHDGGVGSRKIINLKRYGAGATLIKRDITKVEALHTLCGLLVSTDFS